MMAWRFQFLQNLEKLREIGKEWERQERNARMHQDSNYIREVAAQNAAIAQQQASAFNLVAGGLGAREPTLSEISAKIDKLRADNVRLADAIKEFVAANARLLNAVEKLAKSGRENSC